MIEDRTEYATAWQEQDATNSAGDGPDEFDRKGEAEERSLAEKLASGEGEKYAAGAGFKGDGVMTTAAHKAYLEATGEFIDGSTPGEKTAAAPTYSPGQDDKITLDYKARTADAKREDGIQKLMKLRGVTREQADRMMQAR